MEGGGVGEPFDNPLHLSLLLFSPSEGRALLGQCSEVFGVLQQDAAEGGQRGGAPEEGLHLFAGGRSWVLCQAGHPLRVWLNSFLGDDCSCKVYLFSAELKLRRLELYIVFFASGEKCSCHFLDSR